MRRLELAGFRAFASATSVDLDADAIILEGPNGSGKTSLLDSLLWILCGEVPRLGKDSDLVSLFSSTGGAHGTLELIGNGSAAEVTRRFDGQRASMAFSTGGNETQGVGALASLCEVLWPDALATNDAAAALTAAITRSVYLQQDLVRQFVEADTDQERFSAVSELVGAGRISEFQVQVDNERTAWSRATNEKSGGAGRIRSTLAVLEARMLSLADATTSGQEIRERWEAWWSAASALGLESSSDVSPMGPQASQALDDAVRQLGALRRDRERRLIEARQLLSELSTEAPPVPPDLEALRSALAAADQVVADAQSALVAAEAAAAEERRRQVEVREVHAELQALAQLALRHLEDRCPVCDQNYDEAATRSRLELLAGESPHDQPDVSAGADLVAAAVQQVRSAEEAQSTAAQAVRDAEASVRAADLRTQDLVARLQSLGYVGPPGAAAVDAMRLQTERLTGEVELCDQLATTGEGLAVAIARIGEVTQREELQREIDTTRERLADIEDEVAKRERAGVLAVRLLDELREASSNVVATELGRIDPLLQQIFSTIDPHPAFRAVRLFASFARRRGRVSAQLEDQLSGQITDAPALVLSSSQLNGLAVSIFLALNLGMRTLPIRSVILDDPLQSLDDVNLLGLVDLLRRIREHRQLIVSTHDPRFGDLLARKLRPVIEGQRTLIYRFHGWTRSGPLLEKEEVPLDTVNLRIAPSAA